jgi:hypothetical protein
VPRYFKEEFKVADNMPRVICGYCHRTFSEPRYYKQHFNANKNGTCKYSIVERKKRRPTGGGGLSIPVGSHTRGVLLLNSLPGLT